MASNVYKNKILLKDAEDKQHIKILLSKLRNYNLTKPKKIKAKKETLSAEEKLLNNRQEFIGAFKTGFFLHINGFQIIKRFGRRIRRRIRRKKVRKNKRWL